MCVIFTWISRTALPGAWMNWTWNTQTMHFAAEEPNVSKRPKTEQKEAWTLDLAPTWPPWIRMLLIIKQLSVVVSGFGKLFPVLFCSSVLLLTCVPTFLFPPHSCLTSTSLACPPAPHPLVSLVGTEASLFVGSSVFVLVLVLLFPVFLILFLMWKVLLLKLRQCSPCQF